MLSFNIISHVKIGHQGVQAKETCSNVSLPLALDSESEQAISQSQRGILLLVLYSVLSIIGLVGQNPRSDEFVIGI